MRRIILGSSSPYRQAQLRSLGLEFDVKKPLLDEEKAKTNFTDPLKMAQGLARLKAESLKSENQLIIGADQLVSLGGQVLGKPYTAERAVEQLMSMQGKVHQIITAVCLSTIDENIEFYDMTSLFMKNLSRQEILDYVELDQPLDCAGSYKIEKNGQNLFSRIDSKDFSAIEGLPLIQLSQILQNLGYDTALPRKRR